jgi:hypothetical protein
MINNEGVAKWVPFIMSVRVANAETFGIEIAAAARGFCFDCLLDGSSEAPPVETFTAS